MAEYKSQYTGQEIDSGIGKANTAVQPSDLNDYQAKIDSSHKLSADLISDGETNKTVTETEKTTWNGKSVVSGTNDGTNWSTITINGTTKSIPIGGGGSSISVKEIDYSNPEDWDSEEEQPTAEVIDDILANKYTLIHVYNILIQEDVTVEMYLVSSGMIDVEETGVARYYYKFDEGDEDEGTSPNIEQYLFMHEEGKEAQMIVENFELGGGSGSTSWGSITGTLSSQTDLQNALNSKGTYSKPSGGIPENDLSQEVQDKLNGEIVDVVLDSNLVGKKLSLIGDSITTYSGWLPSGNAYRYPRGAITNVEQTWWKKLLNKTGMVIGQNCAWDGSTCSGLSTSTTNAYAACSDKRISQLGLNGDPDIVICYIGINDWGATYNKNHTQYGGTFIDGAFVPVGDYTGEAALPSGELKTFSEAYGCMIGKIQNSYPNAKIYCCTLPQTNGKTTYNYDADGAFPSINRDGVSIADYNDCIRMLANNFGVEVIEFAKCGITWGNITTYMEDGLHPRPDGMTLLADKAAAKLYDDFGVSVHGGSPTPTPTTDYTITNNLTHVTTNNNATTIAEDASYIATLTAESTYNLQSVTVTMGGTDITATAYNNGTITIVNVTGNLVITATATAQASYSVTNNLTNVTTSNNTASVIENASYSATLSPATHYTMGTVTVTMGDTDITSTAYDDGDISIASVTGNLVITATGNAITYTVTNTLSHATNTNTDTSVIEGSSYTGTISADSGYELSTVTVEMGGVDITSTAYSNGTISIASVTGNIVITVTTEAGITWYTNFTQTGRSGFQDASRGWALHPTDYQAAYGVPINRISFSAASNKTSGTLNICTSKYNEKTNFSNIQNINWDSSNMNGNVVTVAIDEITLASDDYLCFFVQNASNGTPAYISGASAGRFYSYVGQNQNWNTNDKYSFQANLGYKPSSNNE